MCIFQHSGLSKSVFSNKVFIFICLYSIHNIFYVIVLFSLKNQVWLATCHSGGIFQGTTGLKRMMTNLQLTDGKQEDLYLLASDVRKEVCRCLGIELKKVQSPKISFLGLTQAQAEYSSAQAVMEQLGDDNHSLESSCGGQTCGSGKRCECTCPL